ncbi:MAG TPA: polyprenol phosphomannose-dependent alpha 1,6 mannosyltransferase MptB [Acidimicrobiales bacterium]|nr:polyprenol phosphomannose-dependent alpha 1,6 mannosyltransferase MptB [Acidimicrobiales bacterium]
MTDGPPVEEVAGATSRLRSTFEQQRSKALDRTARMGAAADRLAVRLEMVKVRVLPASMLADRVQPGDGEPEGWQFLRRPALLGFLALCSIAVGASLPSSPFKLEMAGTWFFGEPPPGGSSESFMLFGLVAVYGGLVLLIRVWYGLMKALARRPGVPVRYLGWTLALWIIPMLVIAPIFSRDVYSYAAQGEMMSHHINPYNYGPYTLGAGPYVNPVDPLWLNTPAPYGPLFLLMDGLFASVTFHHVLATVVLLRLSALAGVVLIAACIPTLARSFGKDHGSVYVMAVLNPLTILMLVGAAHNDALMLGLLVAGVTVARSGHPVWGVLLCALAAAIKVPAAIGVVYIGWEWAGRGVPWRQRVRPLAKAGAIATAVVLGLSVVSGLGIGWIGNLDTPGTVRSWLAPATGVGMLLSGALHTVGLTAVPLASVLSVTRVLGLAAAAGLSVYLLVRTDRFGAVRAMGISMLLFVVLGPVVQPWYLTWGVVLLAPIAAGKLRAVLVAVSALSPFIGLPGGRTLLDELIHYNPAAVAAALMVLLVVLVAPIGRWSSSWADPSGVALARSAA